MQQQSSLANAPHPRCAHQRELPTTSTQVLQALDDVVLERLHRRFPLDEIHKSVRIYRMIEAIRKGSLIWVIQDPYRMPLSTSLWGSWITEGKQSVLRRARLARP